MKKFIVCIFILSLIALLVAFGGVDANASSTGNTVAIAYSL